MDFQDWNDNDPAPMQPLCDLITVERKKAWNAALHSVGQGNGLNVTNVIQLRERCAELYKANCDMSTRMKILKDENSRLLGEIGRMKEEAG